MGEAELLKRQPSARTLLPHHLCSQTGRTGRSLQCQRPAPSVQQSVHPASQTPKAPTFPAGEAPPGARHRDYLEWQRSSAIGSVPRPAWVGMEPATSSRETPKNKSGPGVLTGAKAQRLHTHPRLRRSVGMTPASCPRIWGARGRKNSGLAFPTPNFARNLRTLKAPRKAAASGRPDPASLESSRRAGPATPHADPPAPQLCGGRACSLARPLTRSLSSPLPPPAPRLPPPPPGGSRPR